MSSCQVRSIMISVSTRKDKKIKISTQLDRATTIQILEECINHLKGEKTTNTTQKKEGKKYD